MLRAAAAAASGRGAPGTAADYLRRALDEPPDPAARPAVLLELGLALASERSPAAVTALREAVGLAPTSRDQAAAALLAARVLGHLGLPRQRDRSSAATRWPPGATRPGSRQPGGRAVRQLLHQRRHRRRGTGRGPGTSWPIPAPSSAWRVNDALFATGTAQPASDALARLAPVLDGGFHEIPPDSLTAVYALLVLIWNGELGTARHASATRCSPPPACAAR